MRPQSKKYLKAVVNLGVAVVVLLATLLLLPNLLVFFMPFIVAWIIALIASPLVRFFEEKLKVRRKTGSAFVIVVVIGLVVLGMYLIGSKLTKELIGLVNSLPAIWAGLEKDFKEMGIRMSVVIERFPRDLQIAIDNIAAQMSTLIGKLFSTISTPTIAAVGNFAKQLPSLIIGIIMCLLSSYFFVAERGTINDWFRKYMPGSVIKRYDMLKRSLKRAVGGYLKAQLKIEVWMYLLLVIGLSVLKIDYALLIAFGIAILDFLPFFGTGTVMVPWAIIEILRGDYKMAIGLLIIWGGGQLVRQIIQPKIVGDSIGVSPIPTLLLLYIGYKFGGVFGMIIAVPLGLILSTMYKEGVFDTTKNSILILINGINNFRRLEPKDIAMGEETDSEEKDKSDEKY